jgi:mRNA-degrading endonuclease RelE of RelBE toxin-antitoxin system
MTTKEIAVLTGLSHRRVEQLVKEIYPEIVVNGRKTILNKDQSKLIVSELRKKGFISEPRNLCEVGDIPSINCEVALSDNLQVDKMDKLITALNRHSDLMEKAIPLLLESNQPKQLEYKPKRAKNKRVHKVKSGSYRGISCPTYDIENRQFIIRPSSYEAGVLTINPYDPTNPEWHQPPVHRITTKFYTIERCVAWMEKNL